MCIRDRPITGCARYLSKFRARRLLASISLTERDRTSCGFVNNCIFIDVQQYFRLALCFLDIIERYIIQGYIIDSEGKRHRERISGVGLTWLRYGYHYQNISKNEKILVCWNWFNLSLYLAVISTFPSLQEFLTRISIIYNNFFQNI